MQHNECNMRYEWRKKIALRKSNELMRESAVVLVKELQRELHRE